MTDWIAVKERELIESIFARSARVPDPYAAARKPRRRPMTVDGGKTRPMTVDGGKTRPMTVDDDGR